MRIAVVGIGADGWAGSAPRRARSSARRRVIGSRAPARAAARRGRGERRPWPSPMEPLLDELADAHGRRHLRPRQRRPDAPRHRRHARAPARPRAPRRPPAPVGLRARLRAPGLAGGRRRARQRGRATRRDARAGALAPGRRIVAYVTGADGARDARARPAPSAATAAQPLRRARAARRPREKRRRGRPRELERAPPTRCTSSRSSVAPSPAPLLARTPGLPDDAYGGDGQLTKRHVRALTLAALAPMPGAAAVGRRRRQRLDRDRMAARRAGRARDRDRDARRPRAPSARAQRAAPRRPDARPWSAARAPGALDGSRRARRDLRRRRRSRSPASLGRLLRDALAPGGRLVANAVTLEGEQVVVAARAEHGGALTRIEIAHAEPLGAFTGWRAQMPVVQWAAVSVTVHFIGAGPGAPDLLTLRAQRLIASCPGLPLRRRARPARDPRPRAGGSARRRHAAPRRSTRSSPSCAAAHARGEDVARLHSGDLSIYSAAAEQMRRLDELGIPWDVTPGVPAFAAAAAQRCAAS